VESTTVSAMGESSTRPVLDFTLEQFIAALQEKLPKIKNAGVRTVEIAQQLQLGETTVRSMLRRLKQQGRLRVVHRQLSSDETLDGRAYTVRAYVLVG